MAMLGLGTTARLARELRRDVKVIHERDPAARGVTSVEILATWPGVHALVAHRIAHTLHEAGVPLVPRILSNVARARGGRGARMGALGGAVAQLSGDEDPKPAAEVRPLRPVKGPNPAGG